MKGPNAGGKIAPVGCEKKKGVAVERIPYPY
jgi:hypothetical protein